MTTPNLLDGAFAGRTTPSDAQRAGFWARLVDLAQLLQTCQARCLP